MRRCKACDRAFRKGASFAKATVLTDEDRLESGLVCAKCRLRAIAFVVPKAITIAPACKECGRGLAAVCKGCHDRVCLNVQELLASNARLSAP